MSPATEMLLPLYLRREPTTDATILAHIRDCPQSARWDVVAYRDAACTRRAARFNWFHKPRPTRRRQTIMFNCYCWRVVWLPPAEARP